MPYIITSLKALRAEFWRQHPNIPRRMIRSYSGEGRMYPTDTRVAWVDFLDSMQRNGDISPALANRATLKTGD